MMTHLNLFQLLLLLPHVILPISLSLLLPLEFQIILLPELLDLLFYHLELRCYIVVELKAREFLPIDAGQLNFYLSAVDDILRKDGDNPTIGIILCQDKDKLVAEYALKDINKPVGVSEYKLLQDIPEYLQSQLPKAEEIELHIKDIEEIEKLQDNEK